MRRRIVSILVCLWVAAEMFAVSYQSYQPTEFRSTSAFVAERPMATAYHQSPITNHQSLTAISASNFAVLNGEGGACYIPSATSGPRRAKIVEPDTEAVGEGVWESPVGETPLILLALLTAFYAFFLTSRSGRKARQ